MDGAELEARFAVPGVLGFETTDSGLVRARVTAASAEATIYLHGAHVTHWMPSGKEPVLFLSERTELAAGRPIRGGVPVIFPWFGPRHDGRQGPQHGFARTAEWALEFAAVAGDEVHLLLTLGPSAESRALGYDHFRLAYRVIVGRTLTLELTVANTSNAMDAVLAFEEAMHAYYAVADVREATVSGLAGTAFLDKVDGMQEKVQAEAALAFTQRTDRVYRHTTATCAIDDIAGKRKIRIEKMGSHTTVVWNPWSELAATMADMEPDAWPRMLCVETANVGESAVTLVPGATHTMRATVSVEGGD